VDPLRRPALGGDPAALVLRVQAFDVQAQYFVGPCGGLVEHLPLRLVPEADVQAPQGSDLVLGQGLGAVRRRRAALDADRRVAVDPALALPPPDRLARDGQFPVDGVGVHLVRRAAARSASTSGSNGSSIAATGKTGGFAPRRAGPVGAASPASIHPHVVSEMR
jgi:hypothetical protein